MPSRRASQRRVPGEAVAENYVRWGGRPRWPLICADCQSCEKQHDFTSSPFTFTQKGDFRAGNSLKVAIEAALVAVLLLGAKLRDRHDVGIICTS